MIIEATVYLIVFGITAFMAFLFQNFYNLAVIKINYKKYKEISAFSYCLIGCVFLLPIIAFFGLRYGIGTDYFSYEDMYNVLHKSSIIQYFNMQDNVNINAFYVEFGYYLLNLIFPSYRALLWGIGFGVFSLILLSLKAYSKSVSFAFALFIYLSTQFIYLMNGMRFAIAILFALVGYVFLARNKNLLFFIMVFIAVLFHKSCLICLAMYFLKQIKYKSVSNTRNVLLFAGILSFPFLSRVLLRIAQNIPLFSRYFSTSLYSASEKMNVGLAWIFHILPVLLPMILLCREEIFNSDDTNILFRICVMEIPFRMLGFFNDLYTRLSRISQIAYVIFIPLVISKIADRKKKAILYIYYVMWFLFYFIYYAIVNDHGDSLPYTWIFSL